MRVVVDDAETSPPHGTRFVWRLYRRSIRRLTTDLHKFLASSPQASPALLSFQITLIALGLLVSMWFLASPLSSFEAFVMMFEAFGFSRTSCVAETYLSYLRASRFGGRVRFF